MKSILVNATWGIVGEVFVRLAKIFQVLIIIRGLGAEQYGRFTHAGAAVALFAVLFDFGITTIAVRDFARHREKAPVFVTYCAAKVLTSGCGLVLLGLWTYLRMWHSVDRDLILLMGAFLWLNDFSNYLFVVFRGREEFWREAFMRLWISVLQLAATAAAVIIWKDVTKVAGVLVASTALALIPLARELGRLERSAFRAVRWHAIRHGLGECLPLAISALVTALYMNCDIIVLAKYVSLREIGWYSAAVKMIFGLLLLPISYFTLASLPSLSSQASGPEADQALRIWMRNLTQAALSGSILVIGMMIASPFILLYAFGRDFLAAVPVVVIFGVAGFLFYVYTPLAQWVLIQNKQKWSLVISAIAAAADIVLLLWWVPSAGVRGAAYAAVVTHAIMAVGNLAIVLRCPGLHLRNKDWLGIGRIALGLFAAWTVLQVIPPPSATADILAAGVFVILNLDHIRKLPGGIWRLRNQWAKGDLLVRRRMFTGRRAL